MKKKLFSLFLAICMMISLVPVTAFATTLTTSEQYDNFQPGENQFMIELILSYNGDYTPESSRGNFCEDYMPDEAAESLAIYDSNGIKVKFLFDKVESFSVYDVAYFLVYPNYKNKIKGIFDETGILYGDVYNGVEESEILSRKSLSEYSAVSSKADGSYYLDVPIPERRESTNKAKFVVSFDDVDPNDIPSCPNSLVWNNDYTATWDRVTDADHYRVTLWQVGNASALSPVYSEIVDTNSYDFSTLMSTLPNFQYIYSVSAIKNKLRSDMKYCHTPKSGLHTHSSTAGWKYDGEYHWKECDTCGEEFDKATHRPSTGACSTCNITPITIKKFWLWFKPTLGGTPATTEILYCGWMDNVNVLDHQLNSNNMKWYKMAANQYTGPSADGSTDGWTEMGDDEQFVTGFMYRVDVNCDKEAGVSYFKNENTNYYVKDNNVKCDSTLFILNDVIRLSGYFSPISAPVTPPSRPSREPDPEPTYLPYITDEKEMTWDEVCEYLKTLNDGDEVDIHLGGADVVPEKVMTVIADKELKVNFIYSYAKRWFVDGAKIETPADTNFDISSAYSLDTSELRGIVGTSFEIFGANFPVAQTISFKTEHAGKFANLFKFEDDKPVFVTTVRIDADGKVKLPDMSAEGEYVIMISEYSDLPGDMDNDGNVNVNDAIAVLKQAAGAKKGENPLVADMNNDDKINVLDAVLILKKAAGRK